MHLANQSNFQTHNSFVLLLAPSIKNILFIQHKFQGNTPQTKNKRMHMASLVYLFCRFVLVVFAMFMVTEGPAYAQISTPCNVSVLSTAFTPCVNYFTNSSGNGNSPTTECCGVLKSLTSGGMDCLCLIVTGSVPFKFPFNRSLAISLPRACNMPGVPVQCKASGSPLPAPGPVSLGPSPSPASADPSGFAPTPSPQGSSVIPSATSPASLAPESDNSSPTPPLLSPPSPSVDSGSGTTTTTTPSASTGSGRSSQIPSSSSAITSYNVPPSVLLVALGVAILNYH